MGARSGPGWTSTTTVARVTTTLATLPGDRIVRALGRDIRYKWVVAIVYVCGLFLDVLDATIVNVALVRISEDLRSDAVEWIVLGYTISLAVWVPAAGWLGDRIGTKRTFLFAFGVFTTGSLLCAVSQSVPQLIAFRIVQGVGGGMLTPVGIAMLFRAFPPNERAKASAVVMVPMLAAPALGPIVGGFLVTHADWRWIFLMNLPIGIPAFIFGWRHLTEHREESAGRFDLPGFILAGAGLAALVFSLSEGPRAGWTSPIVVGSASLAAVALSAMVFLELNRREPMLDLRLLGNRLFRQCNVVSVMSNASFLGVIFLMPQYLQLVRGQDAFHSGLTTFPQALGVMLSSQVAARLYPRIGPRRMIAGGMFASALVILVFTGLTEHTDLWLIRGVLFVRGLCMGFAFVPMQAASYATIRLEDNGRASSLFSAQRQMAASMGIAITASVVISFTPLVAMPRDAAELHTTLIGFRWAFATGVVIALFGAIAARFIRDSDAAPSMTPRH